MLTRTVISLSLALALTACTANAIMRPDVDVGMQTSALVPPALMNVEREYIAAPESGGETQSEPFQDTVDQNAVSQDTIMQDTIIQDTVIQEPMLQEPFDQEPIGQKRSGGTVIAAGFSRLVSPFRSGTRQDSAMPASEANCRRELRGLGVTYRDLPAINDGGSCRIAYPVEVSGLPGRARLTPAATLNCEMALTVSRWVKSELQPAARLRYLSGVATITNASSYSCRNMVGTASNKISEHAKGNALDISKIELKNGKDILVRKKGFFSFREKGLLNTVRADGCNYFSTVLGPGYNKAHADHFHFDIMERKSGYTACK